MLLEEMSWRDAKEAFQRTDIVLVPTGSTEQHGPHCPLGTDFMIAQGIARVAANAHQVVCVPTTCITVSPHHRQFPGTLWVQPDTFRSYMTDVTLSLNYHGVNKIVFVNGHGGNGAALAEVAYRLRHEHDVYAVTWNWFPAIEDVVFENFDQSVNHADGPETSMMLFINEDLVQEEYLEEAARGASPSWGQFVAGAEVSSDTIDFSESGAAGSPPTAASKEKGEILFAAAVEKLGELIAWLREQDLSELRVKPPK
ncbi:MAG: creatininase family protein [Candidatus Bipolaricaulia bacterium]